MIRGLAQILGVTAIASGIVVAIASGWTIDGRTVLLCGGGLLAVVLARPDHGRPA